MIFKETPLPGAYVIELEKREDDRGFFARAWCQNEFEEHGLNTRLVQCNLSYNHKSGTLRGMHFQAPPKSEVKLIRCTRGAVWDVIVDLRRNSPTHKHWYGEELTSDNRKMMYVPEEFAHGYITLVPDTETFYQVTEFYSPDHERGIRWNDPAIGIEWPDIEVSVVSEKDAAFPDFKG